MCNGSDTFGLKVIFLNDEARQFWTQLQAAAREAMGSDDKGVVKAATSLLNVMQRMWNEPDVVFRFQANPWPQRDIEKMGGGEEVCGRGIPTCYVDVATNGGLGGPLTRSAHELGAAWGTWNGIDHYGMTGGVQYENMARRVFGCGLRVSHDKAHVPASCR